MPASRPSDQAASRKVPPPLPCRSILVLGGGVMGRGIATLFAEAGIAVTILSRRGGAKDFSHPRIAVSATLPAAAPDLVVENVPEELAVKRQAFAEIEAAYGASTVMTSNTSGLSLTEIAAPLKHKDRFLGFHFFMPAEVFPMAEVIRIPQTSDAAVGVVLGALRQAKRDPVLLDKPVPGFLINRLQHAILHEAYALIADGVTTPDVVDAVARRLLGPRMCVTGLIEQKDISGLRIHADAQRAIVPHLAHDSTPVPFLQEMAGRGQLGLAAGKGFYDWSGRDAAKVRKSGADRLRRLMQVLEAEALGEAPPDCKPVGTAVP